MNSGIVGNDDPIDAKALAQLFGLWNDHKHIALAVSGGADSTALMRLATGWLELYAPSPPPSLTILTVDHGLRPEAADEAEWVKRQAADLGLAHVTLRWEGLKPKSDLQAVAREARYGLMTGYCHAHNITALATAHTRDDQIETFIMRLARGSGLDGLSAMSGTSIRNGIVLLRPLLGLSRPQIEGYLRKGGHSWIDDPSNRDERFERVRLRRALPALDAVGLERDKLALSVKRLNRARQAVDAVTGDFLRDNLKVHPAGFGAISISKLLGTAEEIAMKALSSMARCFGGKNANPRLAKLEAFYEMMRGEQPGATLGGCRFQMMRDRLVVTREIGRMDMAPIPLAPGAALLWDGRFKVSASAGRSMNVMLRPLGPDGLKLLKQAGGSLVAIPRPAALTLPSFWSAGALHFVPCVTFDPGKAPPSHWQPDDRAEFVKFAYP